MATASPLLMLVGLNLASHLLQAEAFNSKHPNNTNSFSLLTLLALASWKILVQSRIRALGTNVDSELPSLSHSRACLLHLNTQLML